MTDTTYQPTDFASGLSAPGNLKAFARAGFPAGFVATLMSARTRSLVAGYVELGGEVFIDSGAFSMKVPDFAPVMECYLELASTIQDDEARGRLSIVAPDVVGDQVATLELLAKWAPVLQVLEDSGVRILIPLQKGELKNGDLFEAIDEAVNSMNWTPAFPCKKAATSPEEILEFVERTWVEDLHCLGLGGDKLTELARQVREICPQTRVTGDSNKLRAMVGDGRQASAPLQEDDGRGRGDPGRPRRGPPGGLRLGPRGNDGQREAPGQGHPDRGALHGRKKSGRHG